MEERLKICETCPICDVVNWICNPKLYIHPESDDIRITPKEGYVKGCGCAILYKYKNPDNHCPAKKW